MTPRKVDPYVYVMEWIWRHSTAKGVMQHVLLRIGHAMKWTPNGFETGPLPTKAIATDTGLGDSTVREQLCELGALDGDLEIVKGRRRGETYRYRLRREQLLPLTDIRPDYQRRMAAVSPPAHSGDSPPGYSADTAISQRSDRRVAAVTAPNGGGEFSDESIYQEVVRTEDDNHHLQQQADAFFAWWEEQFPIHNNGARSTVGAAIAIPLIVGLLVKRDVEKLQAMSMALWQAETGWIATTDRSIRVLAQAADTLDQLASRQPRLRADVNGHVPPCRSWADCRDKVLADARAEKEAHG